MIIAISAVINYTIIIYFLIAFVFIFTVTISIK